MTEPAGKTILVTGGASGIGLSVARAFAGAGATVAIADIDLARAQEVAGTFDALAVGLDVASAQSWTGAIAAVNAALGPIDMLCNSAGVVTQPGPFVDNPPERLRRLYEINLFGAMTGIRLTAPGMRGRGGHILNIASIGGMVVAPLMADYSSAKAALIALSECLAVELAADGIGVTVVCPAAVATRLTETSAAAMGQAATGVDADRLRAMALAAMKSASGSSSKRLDPDTVGAMALAAVRAGDLYCFTHAGSLAALEARWAKMRAAFATVAT